MNARLPLSIIKAHAYGNDFLYVPRSETEGFVLSDLARRLCARHRGAGGDGLIVYDLTHEGATMELVNADGSYAELSGNGLRALAAIVVRHRGPEATSGAHVRIGTNAGPRDLVLTDRADPRFTFRAAMGQPAELRQLSIDAGGETVVASVFSIGNPQCVILGPLPSEERFVTLGPALERHSLFPQGTNVEFVHIEAPDRARIRIWERGVGPTESSGTGACASAIAAIAHGGASPRIEVVSPGGSQVVEWNGGDVYLTGWAELVWEGTWLADL